MIAPLPDITVVVPSHGRLLRLRWLLNALEEQTLDRSRFEVVVVHDYPPAQAAAMLESHPLRGAGVLRLLHVTPAHARAARQRNLGWRAARAPLVAFTDDDCRPEPDWLETLHASALRGPGAVIQGTVRPDPLELDVMVGVLVRSVAVVPPDPRAQTANMLYPRSVLERVGGFDEQLVVGEDMDLLFRCRRAGARFLAARDAVVNHAIEACTLLSWARANAKWQDLPLMLKRQPGLRRYHTLGVFWDRRHVRACAAVAGLAVGVVRPRWAGLALPYVAIDGIGRRGPGLRARFAAGVETPRRFAGDLVEVGVLVLGSVRYRTLML